MKIKEVQAGIKLTKNYNSYQASLTAELETGEAPEKVGAELMEKASNILKKKTGIDLDTDDLDTDNPQEGLKSPQPSKTKEIEVGAAWPDKEFTNRLSIKDSRTGHWKDLDIADLEKINEGYKQKTEEGTFIFRKLPEAERIHDKMPTYRIYKVEEPENLR